MRRFLTIVWALMLCLLMMSSALMVPVESDESGPPQVTARCRGGSSERTVLVEVNTADWCQYCPTQAHSLGRLYAEVGHENMVVLEYHGSPSDELTSTYSQLRSAYYGGLAYPAVAFDGGGPYNDGRLWGSGGTTKFGMYVADRADYEDEKRASARSNMTISVTGNITSTNGYVKAHIEATDPITLTNLKVRFVVYQNNIYHRDANTHEGYGILHRVYNHIVRIGLVEAALPAGFNQGDTFDVERSFIIDPTWYPFTDKRALGVAVFVQTDNKIPRGGGLFNAEVLQAASIEFVDTPIVLIPNDSNDPVDEGFDRYDEFLTKAGLNHWNWDTYTLGEDETMNVRTPPQFTDIQDYNVQLWFTGTGWGTFDNPITRTCVDSGLSADHSIFAVGEEIAFEADIFGYGSWLEASLHATYVDTDSGARNVGGIPGDPITDGMMDLELFGTSPDVISPAPGGVQIFEYLGAGTTAAVRAEHDLDSGVVYMAFNYFEGVSSYFGDPNYNPNGEALMTKVHTYLDSVEPPRVDILQPDGGEALDPSRDYEIHWSARDVNIPQGGVTIEYALNSDSPVWVMIANGEPNDGIHLWNVPVALTARARIRVCVTDSTGQSACATSDADFSIGSDDTPPKVADALVDGQPSVIVTEGTGVTLTANVDDTQTEGSSIDGANFTIGFQNWPGTDMSAQDGQYDDPLEDVIAIVDTTGWALGDYDLYVYAWDEFQNHNVTSTEYARITIALPAETIPPEISNPAIDGLPSQTYFLSTKPSTVRLSADLNDSSTGNSNITGANYTMTPAGWPGVSMSALDGSFDSPAETVYHDITTPGAGDYQYHVYAWDEVPNYNNTGPFASLTILDDVPPEISNVLLDGSPSLSVIQGTPSVSLTAFIDDSSNGGSAIQTANYTMGIQAWPGWDMDATDGAYDESAEDVNATVDTSSLTAGFYDICVYAIDGSTLQNENTTGDCAQLQISLESKPPEISDVLIDGQSVKTVSLSTLPVVCSLTATVNDSGTGGSNIAGANYTTPTPASWPGHTMNASDGIYDSPVEDVNASIDAPLIAGTHPYYVYAWDDMGNHNNTAPFAFLVVEDDVPPEISSALVNGSSWADAYEGDLVFLNATITDEYTGDSLIGGANYTVGVQNWPGVPMNATDGAFDSSVEDITIVIDTTGWPMMNHTVCVYAWDVVPNENTSSTACVNIDILAVKPLPPEMIAADLSGIGLSDVILRWNRSGDDGIGKNSVIEYDIYRSTSYSGPYSYVTSVPATDSPEYSWTCSGCGVGDMNNYFFYVEADDGSLTRASPNKASKFIMSLTEGPQLISVPLITSSDDVSFVLQTVRFNMAYYYDSGDASDPWKSYMPFKAYKGDLRTVDRTMGLWVNVTSASDFVVAGLVPETTTITLRAGWNLVGFPSFGTDYTVADLRIDVNASNIEEPDPMAPPYCLRKMSDVDALMTGKGYWIEVPEDVVWTLDN